MLAGSTEEDVCEEIEKLFADPTVNGLEAWSSLGIDPKSERNLAYGEGTTDLSFLFVINQCHMRFGLMMELQQSWLHRLRRF